MTSIPLAGRAGKIGTPLVLSGLGDLAPIAMDSDQLEAWILSLPPIVQARVQSGLKSIAQGLPPLAQVALAKEIIASGHQSPIALPLEGLGCDCVPGTSGLGQWGQLAAGLIQAGSNVYSAKLSNDLSKSLAAQAGKNDAALVKAQSDAALATQKLLADAQIQAAQVLAASQVERSRINAPAVAAAAKWGGIAGVLVLAGAGFWYLKRRKKK